MEKFTSRSEQETYDFAKNYAKNLVGGEVLALEGDLGAGKTVFSKGLAEGLGIKRNVNSPTFVIMKVYSDFEPMKQFQKSIKHFVHIDAYRLHTSEDLLAIGADEYFRRSDAVVVIEWPERIKKILPVKTRWLRFLAVERTRIIAY